MEYQKLRGTRLFQDMTEEEIAVLLDRLSAATRVFEKNAYLCCAGEPLRQIGLVQRGAVHIVQEDFWGAQRILARVGAGELFGESYAGTPEERLRVSVVAAEETEVLLLEIGRVLFGCPEACGVYTKLIRNLVAILSERNRMLTRKIEHISKRTTREKVLAFLSDEAVRQGGGEIELPFNRQQMADYLAVERSALSAELSRMQRDRLISFEHNRFRLYR